MAHYKWTNDPEFVELLNSLLEKTKDVQSPLNITELTKTLGYSQYSKKFDVTRRRIAGLRPIIHKLEGIDDETKVKLLFGLSGFVHEDFLEKLQERADVKLDDEDRIIYYKIKGAGLQLSGTHARGRGTEADTIERNERMLGLLARIASSCDSPITNEDFVRRFIEETGSTLSNDYLRSQFFLLKNEIHKSDVFDQKTKVRMCFISGASIPEGFQKILREDAHVLVDSSNRIIRYKSKDGSMELEKKSTKKAEERKRRTRRSTKRASELAASSENGSTSETKRMKATSPGTEESNDLDPPPNFEVKPFRGDLRAAEPLNRTEADEDVKVYPLHLQQLLVPKLEEEVGTIQQNPSLPQQLLVPKQEEEEEDRNTQQILNPPLLVPKEEVEEEDLW